VWNLRNALVFINKLPQLVVAEQEKSRPDDEPQLNKKTSLPDLKQQRCYGCKSSTAMWSKRKPRVSTGMYLICVWLVEEAGRAVPTSVETFVQIIKVMLTEV